MIFHGKRLLADIFHEISYLIFLKTRKDVAKFVVCCSRDLGIRDKKKFKCIYEPAHEVLVLIATAKAQVSTSAQSCQSLCCSQS